MSTRPIPAVPAGPRPRLLPCRPGEFFSILGPSGSGKTTILRMIAGFETPDRGRILMDGADITEVPPNRRDVRTGVPELRAVSPSHRAGQCRIFAAHAAAKRRPNAAARPTRRSKWSTWSPTAAGCRTNCPAASASAALARRHRLRLEDPAAGRAARRARSEAAPADAAHAGVAAEGARHRLHLCDARPGRGAVRCPHRIAVMRDGRIAQLGTAQDLYFAPTSEFVAQFVGRSNLMPVRFEPTDGRLIANIAGETFRIWWGRRRARAPRPALRGRDHRARSRGAGARRAHGHRRGRAVPRHQFRGQCAGRRPERHRQRAGRARGRLPRRPACAPASRSHQCAGFQPD